MSSLPLPSCRARLIRPTAVMAALLALSAAAAAQTLSPFTLNPSAVGLGGSAITADNMLISDFSTVTFSGSSFSEVGYLSVAAFQLGGSTFTPAGLNSSYGFYVAFNGSGTTTTGNPAQVPTVGSFTSLTYDLYAYTGSATFDFSGNTPTTTASSPILLASGSLITGAAGTIPSGDGSTFVPTAAAQLTFDAASGASSFFESPTPFYGVVNTAFTNTTSTVEPFTDGFRIRQGGGSINFVSAVPEPSVYALMLAGLGIVGFCARRRRNDQA